MQTSEKGTFRIVVHGGAWTTNIGNAFIHFGALALVKAAAPNATLTLASGMPRWFFRMARGATKRKWFPYPRTVRERIPESTMDNALDMIGVTDCDLLIITGMTLCREFVEISGPPLRAAVQAGTKVIFLGAGAQDYSEDERRIVLDFLRELKPLAFISRDDDSFAMFGDAIENSTRGVDCGFFVPEAYSPFPLRLPSYVVAAFDSSQEPALDLQGRLLMRAHHGSWGPIPLSHCTYQHTLVSDLPEDYLALYASADEVHSDRVHACVATLAYGGRARLYSDTPRAGLFSPLGAAGIRDRLVALDENVLSTWKNRQIQFLRGCIERSFGDRC